MAKEQPHTYVPVDWINNKTKLSAKNLNQMDEEIQKLREDVNRMNSTERTLSVKYIQPKQDYLRSGENIKTINGESILGPGNIDVGGGPGPTGNVYFSQIKGEPLSNEKLAAEFNSKLDTPIEPVEGQGVNVPYYFDVEYSNDKAVVKDYTIDLLDKEKAPQQFSLDITAASETKAGLMTADNYKEIYTNIPADIAQAESSAKSYTDIEAAKKVDLLGNEIGSGEPYHFTYYYDIQPKEDRYDIEIYTITLDNNKTLKKYNYSIPAASNILAGLMGKDDKVKLEALRNLFKGDNIHTGTEPIRIPYYFDVKPAADKIRVVARGVSLNSNNEIVWEDSDIGTNGIDILPATIEKAGLMSATDKIKLESIAEVIGDKINKLGNESVSGEPYHFTYYYNVEPKEEKITVGIETITLDNNKTLKHYELDVNGADASHAGLLTKDGYDKLYVQFPDVKERVDNLQSRGRFLSNWKSTTGLPETNPSTSLPYAYKAGDYYIVSIVGATNYKPVGVQYTGVASTTVETSAVNIGDYYTFDGTNWLLINNTQKAITFKNISGDPKDNDNLKNLFDSKQDILTAGTGINITNNVISSTIPAPILDYVEAYDIITSENSQNAIPYITNPKYAIVSDSTIIKYQAAENTAFNDKTPETLSVTGATATYIIEGEYMENSIIITLTNITNDVIVTVKAFGE